MRKNYQIQELATGQWKVTDLRDGKMIGVAPDAIEAGRMIEAKESTLRNVSGMDRLWSEAQEWGEWR